MVAVAILGPRFAKVGFSAQGPGLAEADVCDWAAKVQVSNNGSSQPVWASTGKELFYIGQGHVMAYLGDEYHEKN